MISTLWVDWRRYQTIVVLAGRVSALSVSAIFRQTLERTGSAETQRTHVARGVTFFSARHSKGKYSISRLARHGDVFTGQRDAKWKLRPSRMQQMSSAPGCAS